MRHVGRIALGGVMLLCAGGVLTALSVTSTGAIVEGPPQWVPFQADYYSSTNGELRLIRFGGHRPKGGYDVPTDGKHLHTPARAPAV
jgi:hypothetical protein